MRFHKRAKVAAVLGCGPAGLFAAHALVTSGWEVVIYSKKRRSEMYGAQYLHQPIPGLSDGTHPVQIDYILVGTPEQYREKVYGQRLGPAIAVSPEALPSKHNGWDIRAAYYRAWDLYSELVYDHPVIGPEYMLDFITGKDFGLVVSTIPATAICRNPQAHQFHSQMVFAVGDAPERGVFCPVKIKPNTVICDATRDVGWYRASNIFGYNTAEWPAERRPPIAEVSPVSKPINNTCDCWDDKRIIKVGRYGAWDKRQLTHHAYERTLEAIR